jgi:hypothetical protein
MVRSNSVLTRVSPASYNPPYWSIIYSCLNARINPRSAAEPEYTDFAPDQARRMVGKYCGVVDSKDDIG